MRELLRKTLALRKYYTRSFATTPLQPPPSQARGNVAIGLTTFAFVGGVYYYTMWKMKMGAQSDIVDLDGEVADAGAVTETFKEGVGGVSAFRGQVGSLASGPRGDAPLSEMAAHAQAKAAADFAAAHSANKQESQKSWWSWLTG
eukprot:g3601.t1